MHHDILIYLLDDDAVFSTWMRKEIGQFFAENTPYPCRIREFTAAEAMLRAAEQDAPELLVTDIELTDSVSGITAAENLQAIAPGSCIIYLSGYLQYAMDIFRTDPLYFIVKDHCREHLPLALKKFVAVYQKANRRLQLRINGRQVVVSPDDIIYCEHSGKFVSIVLRSEVHTIRSSLPEFAERLPGGQFAICHKSFLVNLAQVKSITGLQVTMSSGAVLNISRSCRDAFRLAHSRWLSSLL